nr:senescence-associated carboxylesterase 101-like [Tanacetum cinerariifolium]
MNQEMFSSELEKGNFIGSMDLLADVYDAVLKTSPLAYKLHTSPSGVQVLAFSCNSLDYTTRFLNGEFELVSSDNHKVVDFISTKVNSKFSINKAAIDLFEPLLVELKELENEIIYKRLVVTGQSVGGYVAILFALWLNYVIKSGGFTCFEDDDAILEVLDATASSSAENLQMQDYGNILMLLKEKVMCRGVSDMGEFRFNSLTAGIKLQLMEIDLVDTSVLIEKIELKQAKMIKKRNNKYEPARKLNDMKRNMLNDMKRNMVCLEIYMMTRRPTMGYYDSYKNAKGTEDIKVQQDIMKLGLYLNQYWRDFVKEKDEMPQEEGANLRKRWLYSGTNCRRIVEPLCIAEYYKNGKKNYIAERPDHFKLLEKWLIEDKKDLKPTPRTNTAASLTEDSCFWAHVEEALISLKDLRNKESNNNPADTDKELEQFEAYLMRAINNYSVSSDIFLEESSLMKWWSDYKTYKGASYTSQFAEYMNNGSYKLYQFGSEIELSKFLASTDLIQDAYHAILETPSTYRIHTSPSQLTIKMLIMQPDYTTRVLNGEFDLVSSRDHKIIDFISTKVNPSFSVNRAAVDLFESLPFELKELQNELIHCPLVVTGRSVGGYLAILFTLWLQHAVDVEESNGYRKAKRPICITYGTPLVGDEALQQPISKRPQWKFSNLNVVAKLDPVSTLFSSSGTYKPFGTYSFAQNQVGTLLSKIKNWSRQY